MNSQRKMVYMQKIFNPRSSNGLSTLNKENFNRIMLESTNKAISAIEGPVKEKHVRRLLIGSYQSESGAFFWVHLPVVKLKENQIVCWKFCHVLHKMLRDGHKQVLISSHERRQVLLDCGNMWRHVESGYGQLIYKYCTLLYNRINFLVRNPGFPNDLKLTDAQLDEVGDNDPNVFFDLSCEIFDALDDILGLQEAVLTKMNSKGMNSMSNSGRCHLAPLVACIQDSSLLYDYSVKILFKLHGSLPPSTLEGHRSRFLCQHKAVKDFYINCSGLQYFRTLIQIPHLADRAPNFLIASDLKQHVAPQVIMISNAERESPDELLVNFDDDGNESSSTRDQSECNLASESQAQEHLNSMQSLQESSTSLSPDPFQPEPVHVISTADTTDSIIKNQERNDERIHELELIIEQLKSDLELEKSEHQATKAKLQSDLDAAQEEIKKIRRELSNLTHQKISSKNAYDKLMEECERAKHDNEISQVAMKKMVKELSELRSQHSVDQDLARNAQVQADTREADLLATEMNEIDQIIKLATRKIEELSENSRKVETGIKLQVNEKISEVCTNLMKAVKNLIAQSRLLQREIVNLGPGQAGKEEKHKLKSDWIDGLVSAANRVAISARSLVDAADRVMSGQGKLTELSAAANEIAAANTQLVVASRVKANRDSEKLKLLEGAAKQVNQCVSNVVDASRVCAELIDRQTDDIDISSLSLHQTKKLELETQVKLLELEQELNKERLRLGLLRRKHYEEEEAQMGETSTTQNKNESKA
uniref:Huntingtin-interacting protein 1 n=1 Tax=Aceria tosichella TaxID=561515 RepID=A0A6G1SB76_9ACAR